MKKIFNRKVLLMLFLISLVVSCTAIVSSVPDEIILFEDEKFDPGIIYTVDVQTDSDRVVRGGVVDYSSSSYLANVKLAGVLPIKTVKVSTVQPPKVVPCGNSIGVRLYVDGLMVIGVSEFPTSEGRVVSPAKDAGIRKGDIIKKVNGNNVEDAAEFSDFVENADGDAVTVTIHRGNDVEDVILTPYADGNNDLKLGIWVRSSVAGIGTMTFYNPDNNSYGALGHGITDSDTNLVVPVGHGNVLDAEVVSVVKGEKGSPGELRGNFMSGDILGVVDKNTDKGIYGSVSENHHIDGSAVEIASRTEVKVGDAQILCCIGGEQVGEYDIEIQKISTRKDADTKCMVIKITDPELLDITGGILQGMSGSPIIQNGKIVGAVTHVFVNDPTRGYGIFIENMLAEAEKIK